MSGNAHTIYILGNQSVDLVLSSDGINVDNRPMNQTKLVVHKGLTNQLNFYVRNRDRVLQNLSTKTLYEAKRSRLFRSRNYIQSS